MTDFHIHDAPADRWDLDFPRVLVSPAPALIRHKPEDFVVDEVIDTELSGVGEHLYLHLRKRNLNTRWLVDRVADLAGLRAREVGYSGLKDRRALTTQWISVPVPGSLDLAAIQPVLGEGESVALLHQTRHTRKLRRGQHSANRFVIRLRELVADRHAVEERLAWIADHGVPNYFGEQRFGHGGSNLTAFVDALQDGRLPKRLPRRDLVLSAARSWLFNQVLAARVRDGSWNLADDREPLVSTGPLWGRGRSPLTTDWQEREREWLEPWQGWLYALEHAGLTQERRPLCLMPGAFAWQWLEHSDLEVRFALPPGAFATSVLREIAGCRAAPPGGLPAAGAT